MTIMTVGDLRKAIENVPDELQVIVYSLEENEPPDDDIETCCALAVAEQQIGEDDRPFFALYANNSDEYEDNEDDEDEEDEDEEEISKTSS